MLIEKNSFLNNTFIPTVWADYRFISNPYEFLQSMLDKNGPTFFVKIPSMGKVLMTGDTELIKEVSHNKNLVGGQGLKLLRPILGNRSTIMLDGDEHLERKKLVLSIFRQISIEQEQKLIKTTEQALNKIPLNAEVKLYDIFQDILLEHIVDFLFDGLDKKDLCKLRFAIHDFMHSFKSPLFIFLKIFQINLGQLSPWGRFLKNRERLYLEIKNVLNKNKNEKINVVNQLAKLELKDQDLAEEIVALLLFGHDTTASAISWLAYNVLSRKDINLELQKDLQSYNSLLSSSNSPFLNATVMESNRITPTVTQVIRLASEDTNIGAIKINKGNRVFPNLYLSHHNPANFKNPEIFDPLRFIDKNTIGLTYIPFGFSQKICAGKNLAERQMQIIASVIFRKNYFELALPKIKYKPIRNNVIISPSRGVLARRVSL